MVDKEKIKESVRLLLEAVGDDPSREGLKETPQRVANMYEKILNGYEEDPKDCITTFESESNDMIIQTGIPLYSFCEHHLVLMHGTMDVAYIPKDKMIGLSKFTRIARTFAKRPQVQERLTKQIADYMTEQVSSDVIVRLKFQHLCMELRGVRVKGSETITIAARGKFLTPPPGRDPKAEFLNAVNGGK